ncbi:CobW family GTP-binding protein [Marinagarivorans cellulosilyticus]|uniref:CobW/HypB/UreG nucleotide-binding domain-containing protein n=1 Tax=Marinagarivorans cellulosilyticus TaxID=2721545 RepID=A0AAN1WJJ2_9GAMM|nr:GTP-binding protein [Marinagarivorans cellulosilyticus]BCD98752.1 hypothetical protein MARGE09_P2953 [Marinagarivorans cellulosilyticus]
MSRKENRIYGVPTNIITGFLGVGKTTFILSLLQQKPKNERWAILVNEFGEIGVDGSLISGNHSEAEEVFIREVPGGCMCCAAGLPMQIALNQLIAKAKPDRLLIEPTGLGHPKEVLEVLSAKHYRDILDIQQCITLVDARKLADTRYTKHDTFNQQIAMADIIVGHKADLYGKAEQNTLINYVTRERENVVPIIFTAQGELDIATLNGKSKVITTLHHHNHSTKLDPSINDAEIPSKGYLKIENAGEGFHSIGWRFAPDRIFNRSALINWFGSINVERAKGVFITNDGVFGYNITSDTITETELDDCIESRLEIITLEKSALAEVDLWRSLQQ